MAKKSTSSIEEVAADIGRLLGTTERHAEQWIAKRRTLLEALHLVRAKASELIKDVSRKPPRQNKKKRASRGPAAQKPHAAAPARKRAVKRPATEKK